MLKSSTIRSFAAASLVCSLVGFLSSGTASAASINAADLDYGISDANANSFGLDFTAQPVWTAGSERSDNGFQNNNRAGRVFVEFQLTQNIIDQANRPESSAWFTFTVDSIGQGVGGTPYTDGLDLRYLGVNASDRSANTLWNTGGVGGADQADILATTGPAGRYVVDLTNASIKSTIAAATAGDFAAFGMSNSTGVNTSLPVGNSTAETYGFQMNQSTGNYSLAIGTIPEPSTFVLGMLSIAGLGFVRRRRRR